MNSDKKMRYMLGLSVQGFQKKLYAYSVGGLRLKKRDSLNPVRAKGIIT